MVFRDRQGARRFSGKPAGIPPSRSDLSAKIAEGLGGNDADPELDAEFPRWNRHSAAIFSATAGNRKAAMCFLPWGQAEARRARLVDVARLFGLPKVM
jgi:hypothetical protein